MNYSLNKGKMILERLEKAPLSAVQPGEVPCNDITCATGQAVPQGQGITSAILILSDLVPLAGILFWGWTRLSCFACIAWKPPSLGSGPLRGRQRCPRSRIHEGPRHRSIACPRGILHRACRTVHVRAHVVHLFAVRRAMEWTHSRCAGVHPPAQGFVDAAAGAVRRSGAIFVNDAVNRFVFAKAPQTNTDTGAIMGGFYKRIVIMHLAIMGGAFIAQAIGTAAPLIVVLLKIAIEIRFQMKARKRLRLPLAG
jgi:hypothetical protein